MLSAALLGISLPASGDMITVTIPDQDLPYTATSASFTLSAQIQGSYDLDNFSLWLRLAPRGGASGVTFNTGDDAADEAASRTPEAPGTRSVPNCGGRSPRAN